MDILQSNTFAKFLNHEPTTFVYGTAWKGSRTTELVYNAILVGYRVVDTAAQPLHYDEGSVGAAIQQAIKAGLISRSEIFIQTKYSPGQSSKDSSPYDATTIITEQVRSSIDSSLHNLGTDDHPYIDCVLLHSPFPNLRDTFEAWAALETFVPDSVRCLGIANTDQATLELLVDNADVKPVVVQNRFYMESDYDNDLRDYCNAHGIIYEAYWVLKKNSHLLQTEWMNELASRADVEPEVALYFLIVSLPNVLVLNGTTKQERMQADLEATKKLSIWIKDNPALWKRYLADFKLAISGASTC